MSFWLSVYLSSIDYLCEELNARERGAAGFWALLTRSRHAGLKYSGIRLLLLDSGVSIITPRV